MSLKIFASVLFFIFPAASYAFLTASDGECPVEVTVVEGGDGVAEISMKNKMETALEIAYDRLPWSMLGRGVVFDVYIDGKRARRPYGAGQNSNTFKIGPKSIISGDVDIKRMLGEYYNGVDKSRVKIKWGYYVPLENIESRCREITGEIPPP